MNAYRDKLVEAMARAMVDVCVEHEVGGKHPEVCPADIKAATAALDAALGVLAEPSAEMVEAGGFAADAEWEPVAVASFRAMIEMLGEAPDMIGLLDDPKIAAAVNVNGGGRS